MNDSFVKMSLDEYNEMRDKSIRKDKISFHRDGEDIRFTQSTINHIEDVIRERFKEEYPNDEFIGMHVYEWTNIGKLKEEDGENNDSI